MCQIFICNFTNRNSLLSLLVIVLFILNINYVKSLNTILNHNMMKNENVYNSNLVPKTTSIKLQQSNNENHHHNTNQTNISSINLRSNKLMVEQTFQHFTENVKNVPSNRKSRAAVQPPDIQQLLNRKTDENRTNNGGSSGGGGSVLELVKNLDVRLKNIRNYELGVTTLQEIFDAMDFRTIAQNDNDTIKKMTNRMSKKLEKIQHVMMHLYQFFINNITNICNNNESNFDLNTLIYPCPFRDYNLQPNYNKQQIEIINYSKTNQHLNIDNHSIDGDNSAAAADDDDDDDVDDENINYVVNGKIVEELKRFNLNGNHLKDIFYLSRWDNANDQNCQYYYNDLHYRYLYVQAIQQKHVFLLIDNGNAFNAEQLELSKTFVSSILQILSESDTISIVLISGDAEPMILNDSSSSIPNFIYPATLNRKQEMHDFIQKLNHSATITNHSRGFEYSFELLRQQNLNEKRPIEFLYISRGLLTKLTDTKTVLQSIAYGQSLLNFPIVINTCAVILDEKRIMYEKQFLRDIAQQNYTKYEIQVNDWYDQKRYNLSGRLYFVTKRNPERIIQTISAIFEGLFTGEMNSNRRTELDYIDNDLVYHKPVLDYNTKDVIISITQTIPQIGVIGVNVELNDLAEDIIYYESNEHSYVFMIDMKGSTIFHPAFSRPIAITKNYNSVPISRLENYPQFVKYVRRRMLTELIGNMTIVGNQLNETLMYNWRQVQNAYIICIVRVQKGIVKISGTQNTKLSSGSILNYQQTDILTPLDLLYHRLDLIPPKSPVCRHFRQIATLETGTVFLSASSFQSPFVYLKNNRENKESLRQHTAQSIMAYIKDKTTLLANPGLLPQIRNDVAALYHVMAYLKKQHLENGPFRKNIIRRYVATTNGVIEIYPGCILGTDLEPSKRSWYQKAMRNAGKIVVTEPYLDAGGAGYIVTIAHTIFEGKANALHNVERDLPIAIVAIDVPYTFFYKLILDSSSFCSDSSMKCLLIEETGYLIAHPSFLEPATAMSNNRRPMEHITHKESFVANDILNHKQLVRKRVCANYQNQTAQRYYTFNTSLTEILTNVVHGDRTKYQITTIPGTNLFAAVLNSTCDGGAFCPCSTVDKVCLNCNRMDQTDCECPCECPLPIFSDRVENSPTAVPILYDYCEPEIEGLFVVDSLSYDWNTALKVCVNINCDLYPTQNECLGVMGCEWCQLDVEGNPFNVGFCTAQNACFNGMLGSVTPYGDGDIGPAIIEESNQPAYSAVGPVGGAIIVSIIIVGFAMYCYRQNLDNSSDQLYPDSIQDDNYGLPLSRFNFDDLNTPRDDGGDLIGRHGSHILHKNLIHPLANSIAVSDISPYHMSSCGYRRPTNGESDNGYSTMTPHEDSEHMCFNLVEPLINSKRLSMSADSMSISTSVSSPTNNQNHHHHHHHQQQAQPQTNNLIPIDKMPMKKYEKSNLAQSSPNRSTVSEVMSQTILPQQLSPHHVLAPVTFHRHMEA